MQNPFSPVSKRREPFKHIEVGERQRLPHSPLTALEDLFLFPDRKCTENKKYGANHKGAIVVQKN